MGGELAHDMWLACSSRAAGDHGVVYDHFAEGTAWPRALRAGLFFGLFTQALISLVDAVYWYRARAPRRTAAAPPVRRDDDPSRTAAALAL
ncbi:hypothetical protein, partial [Actinoplanes regularis]|uniref:hypothetical protein n=1 Tax=Actinoplanes regularis TaxID=52697 RepID=UPI001944B523